MRYKVAQAHCEWLQQLLEFYEFDPGDSLLRAALYDQACRVTQFVDAVMNNPVEGTPQPGAKGGGV